MVKEDLKAIFEAEARAREEVEAARKRAEEILESARVEVANLEVQAREEGEAKAKKVIATMRSKAEADVEELLKKNVKEIRKIERKATDKHDRAVRLILKEVTG